MNDKVSIIIPVYNVSAYLPECMESVFAQTYENLEIILVDDGSSDASSECCDKYVEIDKRIKVVHKKNGGLVSARKAGLELVTGKYIFNLDGDDWIDTDTIETCIKRLEKDESDIIQFGYYTFGNNQDGIHSNLDAIFTIEPESLDGVISDLLKTNGCLNTLMGTKIYKTRIFRDVYSKMPDTIKRADDLLVFVMALPEVKRVTTITNCFLHYRMRRDSKSHLHDGMSQVIDFDNTINHVYSYIKNKDFYSNVTSEILDNWAVSYKIGQLNNELKYYGEHIPVYKMSDLNRFKGKRLILYGAGAVGRDYYRQLSLYNNISVVRWVDKDPLKYSYDYYSISGLEDAFKCDYDYVIIAVQSERLAVEIWEDLTESWNVLDKKIVWDKPHKIWERLVENDKPE
ncbi:glycosyltransferase family 2 protein [Butyrivibrio sp. CB08]|uniref:glycosyltransferase family 2 protein n=1 Tax=Butyrivibrio sp. CB08 TaxID=2364879 RepID=UPI000EA9A3B6|nr:glycosyltransferase family 2 protein [Butyrivibrio sp. CB08]RKM60411.1 glycosyltransferase family 2 protein [Butyrivibrio sp. CB08]